MISALSWESMLHLGPALAPGSRIGDSWPVNTLTMRLSGWFGIRSGGSIRAGAAVGAVLVAGGLLLGWLAGVRALGAVGVALIGLFAGALVLAHLDRTRWWGIGLLIALAGSALALFAGVMGLIMLAALAGWDFD